jgi:hypothetical protein
MKDLVLVTLLITATFLQAQNVGINNPDPQTALDILGRLRLYPIGVEVTSAFPVYPVTHGYISFYGTPGTDFSIYPPSGYKGSFLAIENTTPNVLTINGLTTLPSGKLVLLFYSDTGWKVFNDDQNDWLLTGNAGTNPGTHYIGTNDNQALSIRTNGIEKMRVSSDGKVGIGNSDPNLSVDITGGFGTRSVIAIPFLNNYTLPSNVSFIEIQQDDNVTGLVTIFDPDWVDGRRIVIKNNCGFPATFGTTTISNQEVKEFVCKVPGGWSLIGTESQLEKITEGANAGWRLLGRDPAWYGNIGNNAVDLSYSDATSSTLGSTGKNSFTTGRYSTASGYTSTAMGIGTIASSYSSTAIGSFNDTIVGSNPLSWIAADPLFYIGNSSDGVTRSNAMVVYKNGNTDINGFTRLGKSTEGAPKIKTKKINGFSPAINGSQSYLHGLADASKILSVDILMQYGATPVASKMVPPNLVGTQVHYYYEVDGAYIAIYNVNGSSSNIGNKLFRMLITYEE